MDKFDYKVLWNKRHGWTEDWFDGDENLGREITTELLAAYGEDGWEVVAAMTTIGSTHKLILKRPRAASPAGASTR